MWQGSTITSQHGPSSVPGITFYRSVNHAVAGGTAAAPNTSHVWMNKQLVETKLWYNDAHHYYLRAEEFRQKIHGRRSAQQRKNIFWIWRRLPSSLVIRCVALTRDCGLYRLAHTTHCLLPHVVYGQHFVRLCRGMASSLLQYIFFYFWSFKGSR